MVSSIVEPLSGECAFCKFQGVLGKSVINKDGWYFCSPCLQKIDQELEDRRQKELLNNN